MKNTKEILLSALLELERRVNDPEYDQSDLSDSGICSHVWRIVEHAETWDRASDCDDLLELCFLEWPDIHHEEDGSRNMVYPVGGKDEFNDEIFTPELWKNPRRRELLRWLIARLQGA